ncbi:hypothetical protein KCU77_g43, partial [Aureobasidium melanogenum]
LWNLELPSFDFLAVRKRSVGSNTRQRSCGLVCSSNSTFATCLSCRHGYFAIIEQLISSQTIVLCDFRKQRITVSLGADVSD